MDGFEIYVPGPVDERIRRLVKIHEGLRLEVYVDSRGFKTIGWGHRRASVGAELGPTITRDVAERLLTADLRAATAAALRWSGGELMLSDARWAAVVDMAFNMGYRGLSSFKRMRAALVKLDYRIAAAEMLDSAWARQVGTRANADSAMMETGIWPQRTLQSFDG